MKINRIEIFGYGKFSQQKFEFNQFQAILGLNEAGKTTMINFIKDILFGFTKRKSTHPYAPKDKSEMGGIIYLTADNIEYKIERLEGKNGGILKITDAQGLELPSEFLKQILGPINRDTFNNLFYFGSPNLSEISKLGKDDLEMRIRQVGVIGIEQWLELKKSIKKAADELYKPRGKKPIINQALTDYQKAKQQLAESQKIYAEYLALNQEYQNLSQELDEVETQKKENYNQLRKVEADEKNWNNYESLNALENNRIELLAGFDSRDLEEINQLNNKLDFLKQKLNKIQTNLEKQTANEMPASYQFYLANRKKFDELYLQLNTQQQNEMRYDSNKRELKRLEQTLEADNKLAGGNESREFSNEDKEKINQLLQAKQDLKVKASISRSSSQPASTNNFWLVLVALGIGAVFVGLIVGGLGLFALVVIGLILAGSGIYLKNNLSSPEPVVQSNNKSELEKLNSQISEIGQKYHIEDAYPEKWTTDLQVAIKKRNYLRQQIKEMSQNLQDDYNKIISYLKSWNLPDLNYQDLTFALNQVKEFMLKNQELQNKLEFENKQREEKVNELNDYHKQIEKLEQQQQNFFKARKVVNFALFKQQYQQQQEARKQQEKINELQNALTDEIVNRLNQYENYQVLQQKISDLNEIDVELEEKLTKLTQTRTSLKLEIDNLVENGTYDELRQNLAIQKTEINDLVSKWLVYQLTDEWIEKVLNLASHGRFPKVQALAQKYFTSLTNQHYIAVEYGKKIKVKTNTGMKFDLKELSKGTMQQLYLALIFALTMSFSDEYPMPIIIDDGFVDFDSVRTKAAIKLMKEIADATQVIYFTADNRIEDEVNPANLLKLN